MSTKTWIVIAIVAAVAYLLGRRSSPATTSDLSAVVNGIRQYDAQGTPARLVYGVAGVDYPIDDGIIR